MFRLRALVIPLAAVAILAASAPAMARERYRREWSDHPGMPRQITGITHDDRGFLWIGSEQGLHRFDGEEVVAWGRDVLRTAVHGLNRGPGGRIVVYAEAAYDVTPEGLEIVVGPDDTPFAGLRNADYSGDGGLWLCDDTGLFRRDPDGEWARVEHPALAEQTPNRVRGAIDGGAFVGTSEGSFIRIHPDGSAETLMSDPSGIVTHIAVKDERTQAFALRFGPNHGVYLVEDGNVRPVYLQGEIGRRWTGMAFRDETLWVVATGEVLAIHDDGRRVEVLGPPQGFHSGGVVAVDHEKSLWLTSFRGLFQFTEPDVILSTQMNGTRSVHQVDSKIVVGRWEGPYRLDDSGEWQSIAPDDYRIFGWGGVSPWSSLWFVGVAGYETPQQRSVLLERRGDEWVRHLTRGHGIFTAAYASDESAVFWIAYYNTLWRVGERGMAPQPVAPLALEKTAINKMIVQDNRVSMVFSHGPYCEGVLDADRNKLVGDWNCETIEGAELLFDLELVDGTPWVASRGRGVLRRVGAAWETVVGERELGTLSVRGISVSPRGGVWIISSIGRVRVEIQDGGPRVVERLGPWIGVPDWMLFGALEESDGTIWLSGMTSAIRIPPHARQRPAKPPRIFVTGFSADGRELSPDTPQVLPATTRRIELSWAAPAFRDPASLRYQVRADSTGDWTPTRQRSFRFVDLGPGEYRIELRASLDGDNWSEAPADIRFEIRARFWQRPTFWVAMGALATIGFLLVQWFKTRQQVRLERQRTQIAMNLHDELGAGLASVGLLADLVGSETLDPPESREVASRVGAISRGLSRALSDIVWTLRPASVDLSGFALFLRQRASDLLSAGDTAVEFDFPDPVPRIRLPLEVRRQIHAIASEALHNAAKHAQASKVRVSLERDGAAWILGISEDGVGLDESRRPGGLGLESMAKRAEAIGAKLSIRSEEGAGCCLELRFAPRVEGRR